MKYNRLKEKFVGYLETQQKMDEPPKTEQSTGAELQARIDKQQIQPVIKSQNNDPTFTQPTALSSESTPCHPAHDDNPEFKEQDNQPTLKDDSSEPLFRPHMSTIAFQPSTESAFRKPPNVSAGKPSSTELKPAGPIPSHQASKPVCSTVGLPRRVEPKQSGAMQAGRKQTAEVGQTVGVMQASNQASRETRKQSKTSYSKQNKENSLYDSQEKPDACKSN
ncbi:Hypothetical predicted protein [Paramuricea clavata]|uniref:Uncharacterized protein n=2 Tax=Paramuricea clavata TaxID=317549 RepID=A0A7D9M384_PARCT|nr:Hypothetical predicted protein [Paramuricea clavata]